jgi:hypothetical protein
VLRLQAVVDDSGKGVKPVFVLAGFVLSAYKWSIVADFWQGILDAPPKISYFKMQEAATFTGPFKQFSTQERDKKVAALVKLITDYRPLAIKDIMPHEAYERVFKGKIAKSLDYPYFLPYHEIMGTLWRYQYNHDWHPEEKADFIFDEQGKESDLIQRIWRFTASDVPVAVKKFVGNRPLHRDEKTFLPLQAADLFAWHVRRSYEEKSRGKEYNDFVWKSLSSLECAQNEWTEERLRKIYDGVRKMGLLFEYDIKPRKILKRHKRILAERINELNRPNPKEHESNKGRS